MPKFIIERDIPGAAELSPVELQGMAQKSASVLRELGPEIQWIQSYIAEDRMYCIYIASSAEIIREHARQAGLPVDKVSRIEAIIDPASAEAPHKARETAFGTLVV
jgi:cell division inhibitor SulA